MSYEVDRITYKGHEIILEQDEGAESPREWENVGEILYTSTRYTLGDKRVDSEEIDEIIKRKDVIYLNVFAYIHSGISLSCSSFRGRAPHAHWDSGQCGIIWCTKEKAVKEWGKKLCTKKVVERAERHLKGEIETYNRFLNGEVVGYVIEGPHCEDSCWGFYPDEKGKYDYAISEAKSNIDYERNTRAKALRAERLEARLAKEQHLALL